MKSFFRKFFQYLHPLNKIHIRISFELYRRPPSATSVANPALGIARGKMTGARMSVLGIDNIRKHYGAHWEKVAAMVHAVINLILRKHLREQDRSVLIADHAYAVLFAGIDEAEAKRRCDAIARDIHDTFLRDRNLAALGLKVSSAVSAIDPAQVSGNREEKDLADLLEKSVPDPLTVVDLPSQATVLQSYALETETASSGSDTLSAGISVGYRPLLDVGTRKVFGFYAVPCRDDTPGLEGYGVLSGSGAADPAALILQLDQLALTRARRQRASLSARGRATAFILPVHYKTLSDLSRLASYQQFCATLTPEEKAAFVFEITGFPRTLDVPAVRGLVQSVSSFGRAVMLRTRLDRSVLEGLAGSGANMLGLEVTGENPLDAGLAPKMKTFMVEARIAKMKGFAVGLSSVYLARAAAGAGFEALAGEAIWRLMREPDPDIRIDTTTFLQAATGT